jgi:hypothetical protein
MRRWTIFFIVATGAAAVWLVGNISRSPRLLGTVQAQASTPTCTPIPGPTETPTPPTPTPTPTQPQPTPPGPDDSDPCAEDSSSDACYCKSNPCEDPPLSTGYDDCCKVTYFDNPKDVYVNLPNGETVCYTGVEILRHRISVPAGMSCPWDYNDSCSAFF